MVDYHLKTLDLENKKSRKIDEIYSNIILSNIILKFIDSFEELDTFRVKKG